MAQSQNTQLSACGVFVSLGGLENIRVVRLVTIRFLIVVDTPGVNESASSKSATAKPVTLGKQPECCVSLKKGLHKLTHDS